jgi:hypothetical protein
LYACFQEPEGPCSLRPSGQKARPARPIDPQKQPKICQKEPFYAVFAAFLAKNMHDYLYLDA